MDRNLWGSLGLDRVKEQFLRVWEILPHPREFDHQFLPGRKLDKKICPGGRGSLAQKIFPGVAPAGGGGCTQLELIET